MDDGYLELTDWRRRVAQIYARWRVASEGDPRAAAMAVRAAKDELFRTHPQSPIPIDERARFGGLSYFDYDPAYRIRVVFEPADAALVAPTIELPTSGSEPFSFNLVGHVALSGPLDGVVLPVFWMKGYAGGLFLPLRDATAGAETYGAGRYLLDTVKGADHGGDFGRRELLLDFNLAFHPSCVYDPKWNCPLAPPASRLEAALRVGERLA